MDASQEVCAICLDTVKESKAILEECRHIFCKICIDKWTDIRMKCPVCNQELKSLSSKKQISKAQNVDAPEEEFDCLDHNFFTGEFRTLQSRLRDTEFLLRKDITLSRFNNAWDALEMIRFEISQKLKVLTELRTFCPKNYLADVYRISNCLKDIGSGNYKEKSLMNLQEKKSREDEAYYCQAQTEEEYYNDSEDYYNNDQNCDQSESYTYYSCITSVETKKKSKNKKKNNKKGGAAASLNSQTRVKY